MTYTAPERGYIQVFVANVSDQEVFSDQMVVEHIPQLMVQENHYYPFGLELAGLSKKGKPEHRWKFQGQEEQTEFGLNWSSFKWRNADVALGRFFSVDPLAEDYVYNSTYAFSENRVVNAVELEGLEAVDLATHQKANGVFGGLFTYGIDWLTSGTRKMSQGVKDYQRSQNQANDEGYVDNVPANDRLKMDYVRENKAIGKMAKGVMEHYGAHHDLMGIVMGSLEGGGVSTSLRSFVKNGYKLAPSPFSGPSRELSEKELAQVVGKGSNKFLDFKTRISALMGYMDSVNPDKLVDAKTTQKMIDTFTNALEKFRDKANDSRTVVFSAGKNVHKMHNGGIQVTQNGKGNFTQIDPNGGFRLYRDSKIVINKTRK